MSGRVWTVTYSNPDAVAMIEADLARAPWVGGRPVVRCGGAWATWGVEAVRNGPTLDLTLWPVDPHDVNPTMRVQEIVIPSEGAK